MSKNQSIKSFFTSKTNNNNSKKEEIVVIKDDDENLKEKKSPERKTKKDDSNTKTPKNDASNNKRQRKSSSELKNLSASTKKSKKNDSEEEIKEILIEDEKENKKKPSKIYDSESESVKNENQTDSSDFDSPIKTNTSITKSANSKRRKLVIESSSEEDSKPKVEKEVEKKTNKSKSVKKELKSDDDDKSEEIMQLSEEEEEVIAKPKKKSTKVEKKKSPKKASPKQKMDFFAKKETKKVEKKEAEIEEIKEEKNIKIEKSEKEIEVKEESKKEVKKEVKAQEPKLEKTEQKTSLFFSLKKASGASVSSSDYNLAKENYHPIKDAFWQKNDPVPYKALAQTLFCMEKTSKRLELLSIVTNYFRSVLALSPKDMVPSIYLLTNKVAPDYEGLELGIGDTVLFKSLAEATGSTLQKLKTEFQAKGDIGLVAEANRCNQKLLFTPKKLTVAAVYNKLKEIASITGNSSQSKKSDLIKSLLVSCDAIEARYLMRSLAGKLRNGLGEQSILVSLAHACTITAPPLKPEEEIIVDKFEKMRNNSDKQEEIKKILEKSNQKVKHAYYQCPNYSIVINAIIEHGLDNLEEYCKLTPGVPLKPMLAYPTKGIHEVLKRFENIEFTCEYKYDGERAQIHILEDGSIKIYSRNSENNTGKYPDIIEFLEELLHLKSKKSAKKDQSEIEEDKIEKKVTSAILDAEVVAYDVEKHIIQPFQVLSTRKRKDAASEEIKVKVCIFAFDLLYLNGKSLIDLPFRKRRDDLYENFPRVEGKLMFAEKMDANDVEAIQEFLDKSIKDGCEGLMIKTLDDEAHYEISKRSHNWLKLKKDYLEGVGDTLDLVVIGGYLGTGKRTGLYGGYLLACYDAENEEYQTICKLGTGLKDNDLQNQFESLTKIKIDKPKAYYRINDTLEQPDHWFEPEQVWEIKCADFSLSPVHTAAIGMIERGKGISLRFPRYLKLRDDKKPEDSTNSEQVVEMYKSQQQMLNLNEKKDNSDDGEEDEY